MDPVTGFATLFKGGENGYGTEEGGAENGWWTCAIKHAREVEHGTLCRLNQPSYYERIVMHLEGDRPMGVYPMHLYQSCQTDVGLATDWRVHWGCVDFDEGEAKSFAYAWNVARVISHMDGFAFVERSRSKGYHVWLFLDDWYPTVLVREALLGACQVVEAPTKEINPKSITLNEGQLGNYVRLPYPGAYDDQERFPKDRRTMVDVHGNPLPFDWFVYNGLDNRAGQTVLDGLRGLYKAPKRILPTPPPIGDLDGDIYKRMGGLAWTIYQDGPLDGGGRGHTLFKMACLLAEDGKHTMSEALQLCIEADERWGKFRDRANGQSTIEGIVRKAFGS